MKHHKLFVLLVFVVILSVPVLVLSQSTLLGGYTSTQSSRECSDGIDNNRDGKKDAADMNCIKSKNKCESNTTECRRIILLTQAGQIAGMFGGYASFSNGSVNSNRPIGGKNYYFGTYTRGYVYSIIWTYFY